MQGFLTPLLTSPSVQEKINDLGAASGHNLHIVLCKMQSTSSESAPEGVDS